MTSAIAELNQLYVASEEQPRYCTTAGRPGNENGHPQIGMFYCKLLLPNGSTFISAPCRKKRQAEQDAARKALEQMNSPKMLKSKDQAWIDLKHRVETAFSNECVLHFKPLMEHFRASIVHKGLSHGPVPAMVLAALDNKIMSHCKAVDRQSESNPARALQLVYRAAEESSVLKCAENLWISRAEPFPANVQNGLSAAPRLENVEFEAVFIPADSSTMVTTIRISVAPRDYYMEVLASKLGLRDAGGVLMSRSISRTPSGTRLFWGISTETESKDGKLSNVRASAVAGHSVYGNAILAAVGSSWKSEGRFSYDSVFLNSYYRLILGKFPTGCYKLARGAVLTAELSPSYTSKTRWRGQTPRCLLNEFCHQSHLLTPTFYSYSIGEGSGQSEVVDGQPETVDGQAEPIDGNNVKGPFMCKLRIEAGGVQEFVSERSYRSCNDAVQSACLQALLHFDHTVASSYKDGAVALREDVSTSSDLEIVGDAGVKPPIGCLVHVKYDARIVGADINETVEFHDDFEFELGSGAVLGLLDSCVANMSAGQTARFSAPAPPVDLLLASQRFSAISLEKILKGGWSLEYTVSLLKYVEAPEERMESAVFSPPLSKQRIDFALQVFQRSQASSLVDFGCGSGSFLEAVLEQPPRNLKHVTGIDISQKALTRCSKSLQTKISKLPHEGALESVTLYEGSIASPYTRLKNIDFATCLEVVEHMDDEPLSKFGRSILGVMSPKVLIVSTPNIEYNAVLHKMHQNNGPEELEVEDNATPIIKLRNDDHRFEWTRAEFADWACNLATKYGYGVEFSGVGGVEGQEPGFASQIAVFTRLIETSLSLIKDDDFDGMENGYTHLWSWEKRT